MDGLSPAAAAIVNAFVPGLTGGDRALRMIRLAGVLQRKGMRADAVRLCLHALSDAPATAEAATLAREVLAKGIPRWHIPILHDRARADAYARALEAAIRPGMLVLDIGTGSGLLAILAARAGAELVIACEQDAALAVLAEENVRRNGCADRVRVIAKHSADLVVGDDLPRRADLLVSEIVDAHLLGEGVLDTVAHARAHLLAPDAPALPSRGAIHVALSDAGLRLHGRVGLVAGVDVSAANAIRPPSNKLQRSRVELISGSTALFDVDLTGRAAVSEGAASRTLHAQRPGLATCLVQWMSLDLGNGLTLDSGPRSASTSWPLIGYPLEHPVQVQTGSRVDVHGTHTSTSLRLWADITP